MSPTKTSKSSRCGTLPKDLARLTTFHHTRVKRGMIQLVQLVFDRNPAMRTSWSLHNQTIHHVDNVIMSIFSIPQPYPPYLQAHNLHHPPLPHLRHNRISTITNVMTRRRKAPTIHPDRVTLLTHPNTDPPNPVILGRGSFGTVYAGVLDSAHPIALKTTNPHPHLRTLPLTIQSALDAHARHTEEAHRQLLREARAIYRARRSPGVVRLYGLVRGALVLERLWKRELPAENISKIRFCAEVATAVSGLHRLGVAHGDVKLGNIMFSNGVKLIDFGLAVMKEKEGECDEVDSGEIGLGSAAYLAPEGWGKVEDVEGRMMIDVYALGMLIYEVFCGFPWDGVESVAMRVMNGERPAWGDIDADVEHVKRVVEACWRQEPEERPDASWVADMMRGIERSAVGPIGPYFENSEKETEQELLLSEDDSKEDASMEMDEPRDQTTSEITPRSNNPFINQGAGAAAVAIGTTTLPSILEGVTISETANATTNDVQQAQVTDVNPEQEQDVVQEVTAETLSNVLIVDSMDHTDGGESIEIVQDPDQPDDSNQGNDPEPNALTPQPSSSGYFPEREAQSSSTTTGTPTPPTSQRTDYPFKQQIEENDIRPIIHVLNHSLHDPHQATLALEAITVLLVTPPNPDIFAHSLTTLSRLTSCNVSARLAKAACLVIHRMATSPTTKTERALRISAGYDILATALRRHPTELPVVLTATTAMNALASSSAPLCSIIVDQGAPAAAMRSLARATRAFKNDLPIASASLQALEVMSKQHTTRLVTEGAVEAIMSAMGSFAHPQVDRLALPTLVSLCRDDEGRRRGVPGVDAVAGAISRTADSRLLFEAYWLLAELSKERIAAVIAFTGSTVVEAVLGSLEDNVDADERIVEAGLSCLTGMSGLGGDICGTLQIMQVFDLVYNLVNARPEHKGIALRTAIFLDEILRQLQHASHNINVDLAFSLLVQLQKRWEHTPLILKHVRSAISVVRATTGGAIQYEHEPKSSLRSIVKRFSARRGNSLRVGENGG